MPVMEIKTCYIDRKRFILGEISEETYKKLVDKYNEE
jgi:uncharacterized membrane protein